MELGDGTDDKYDYGTDDKLEDRKLCSEKHNMKLRLTTKDHISQKEKNDGKFVKCKKCKGDIREIEEHYQCDNGHQEYYHRDCKDSKM